jgi:3-oxoacyl-[acyl-carrier-protein] synthase-3
MYVPERILTNADLERMVETSDAWIRERTGISERRIGAPEQASSDLALIASQRALDAAGIDAGDIDQIILATTTPDRILPSCACTLQAKLGAKRAAAYDVFAACTGFIYGMGIARGVIGTGLAENVLLVGVEMLSRIVDYGDRNTCVLFGDGAGAAVIRPCAPGDGILGDLLEVPAGGSLQPASEQTLRDHGHFIKMRGRELFRVAVRGMEESLRKALDDAGLTPESLDLVIPHQANRRIIDATRERLGVPADKVILNIDRYGNTSSASIPISLDEVVRAGRLKPGDKVGFVAFGGGATWGATVSRWTMPVPVAARTEAAAGAVAVVQGAGS